VNIDARMRASAYRTNSSSAGPNQCNDKENQKQHDEQLIVHKNYKTQTTASRFSEWEGEKIKKV
jgi:hypothetical protein